MNAGGGHLLPGACLLGGLQADLHWREKGLIIIKNARDFEYALTTWYALPVAQKNWERLKRHFHEAQQKLRDIRGPTMQQAGYHHANALAQQLQTNLQEQAQSRDEQLMAILNSFS